MTLAWWPAMALFVAQVLFLALFALTASGHFPSEGRVAALRTPAGALLLWVTIAAATCAGLATALLAARSLSWPEAVIGGGAAILFAPLLLQPLPDRFVDGRTGLVVLAAAAVLLAAVPLFYL